MHEAALRSRSTSSLRPHTLEAYGLVHE
jgi:hypothetical protein